MIPILQTYRHIVNPKLRYIYLSFESDGSLVIKSPKVSQKQIERVLMKRSAWIRKSQQRILNKKGKPLQFNSDDKIYYLGKAYKIIYLKSQKLRVELHFDDLTGFTIRYNQIDSEKFMQLIEQFYKSEAQKIMPDIIQMYIEKMQLYPSRVSFRKAKRQWGSCSIKNTISFNYLMMKLPLDVIQYIVVHELAHIEHKHHQKAFWNLVALHMPEYKQYQQELQNYL